MFDDLAAVGRRISGEAQAGRPGDQPTGETARLSSVHWYLSPVGDVEIQNFRDLFTEDHCAQCFVPLGVRTRLRMTVRYDGALSRRCDGVLAQLPERPKGPTFRLFTKRFLSLLTASERRPFRWRTVVVSNPTKITPPLFELVSSEVHIPVVALRGGNPDRERCEGCGRHDVPSYPLVGCLPTWLNPTGVLARGDQPDLYIAAQSLPDPVSPWFTIGDWLRGAYLVVSSERMWSDRPPSGTAGIHTLPLGAVGPHLIDARM